MQLDPNMTEAAASAAAGAADAAHKAAAVVSNPAFWGAGALGFFAFLGTLVVMLMTKPRDDKEHAVAIISSGVSSICLGAFCLVVTGWWKWMAQAQTPAEVGLVIMSWGGIIFAWALPGWGFTRIIFNTLDKYAKATVPDVVHDASGVVREFKDSVLR